MIVAGLCVVLLEHPASSLSQAIPSPDLRRAVIGIAMGATAVAIIYSPWGRQSGAHLNPAMTLTFLRLGKVAPADALFYVLAQFTGGAAGTLVMAAVLGDRFILPPISAVATLPGRPGELVAFGAEVAIAFILMSTVLAANASARLMRWTGVCAGVLVAIYIAFEAPLSGMSLNPARSVASAVPSGVWRGRPISGSDNHDFSLNLACQVVAAQWREDSVSDERQVDATLAAMMGMGPRDALEGMLIAQAIASHNAAMECYRRAMISEQTFEGRRENLNQANKLSRNFGALTEALDRHRGKGQQRITVEHVNVHAGGQAIVGAVTSAGASSPNSKEQTRATREVTYEQSTPMRSPHPPGGTVARPEAAPRLAIRMHSGM